MVVILGLVPRIYNRILAIEAFLLRGT